MAAYRIFKSWTLLVVAAFLLLGSPPARGRRHGIRHGRQRRQHHFQQNVTLGLDANGSGPWGPWSSPSLCSRTCGGGVSFQSRTCEDFSTDGRHSCTGSGKRYVSCNVQDCPDLTKDFREEQCARFNSLPFEGKHYSWVPYHKAANPCELNCKPKGERFYYRHSQKVIDGTRCYDDGSLDVCVDGQCMPVGCDKQLGSTASEDKCRVCRGDGSSCSTIEGTFDLDNLQVGYNDILLIPAGATNIRIEEKYPTNNYLAVRNGNGLYYLNGNWRIEFPRSIRFAGTIFHYERKTHDLHAPESLMALGPTNETIFLVLLYQEKNLGITYGYSVPANASSPHPDNYNWNSGDFGECSQTCGGGVQTRSIYCSSATTFEKVSNDLCNPTIKPEASRTCNTEPCPATWYIGEWEPCSRGCGNGTQLRLVFCQHLTEGGSLLANDTACLSHVGPKPERQQDCSSDTECATWEVGEWSECDRKCGEGTQVRDVQCIKSIDEVAAEVRDDGGCDESVKPESNQTCVLKPCGGTEWMTSSWSGCEGPCSARLETREVMCASEDGTVFPDDHCDEAKKPNATKPCDHEDSGLQAPCQFMWYSSQWSPCSVECGRGLKTRKVFCGTWEDGTIQNVTDDNCDAEELPKASEECELEACSGLWVSAPWDRCSTPCGGGQRTRIVLCQMDGKPTDANNCDATKKPFDVETCNMNACDEDEVMTVGGCKSSKHGCCPDGMTPAGPNFEGCPKVLLGEGGCEATEFGCCLDEVTPAFGPFKKGCQQLSLCNGTEFGCCADGETVAEGPDQEGCLEVISSAPDCNSTDFGCCPDGFTPAAGTNFTGCDEEVLASTSCAGSQFGCCPDNITAADGPQGLNCIEGSGTEEPCHGSEHGCCPDGFSPALGPDNEGCPNATGLQLFEANCTSSSHGCCPDGVTAAEGPGYQGCEDIEGSGEEPTDCENTLYGCCADNKTPAKGEDYAGCANCTNSTYGCCKDGTSEATGPDYEGCANCTESPFGCCEDGVTTAQGPNHKGCCSGATFGCCPDNVTEAAGPDMEGCPICTNSTFGCCPDQVATAQGPNFEGCDGFESNCTNTTFGCCPDGISAATGEGFMGCGQDCEATEFGCCPDGLTPAMGVEFEGCDNCTESLYGCCADNVSFAMGADGEGCCFHTEFGCCHDNKTAALGPDHAGCSCHTTPHGCCPDGVTVALGPRYYGCTCEHYPYGCCQDKHTPAGGPNLQGCICSRMLYGCCPDGQTPAEGERYWGCSCKTGPYGCCPDGRTPAHGPSYKGCTCDTMPYGCCPDQRTPARGPGFGGCPCSAMAYGCCPDEKTAAQGPDGRGCECQRLVHGCCPDNRTPAQGPNLLGCTCESYPYGCCQDGRTPARGPNFDGCDCSSTRFGCCPDGRTPSRGPTFEGCPVDTKPMPTRPSGNVCGLPEDLGPCRNYTIYWFFNMKDGRCNRFWYGGCEGNGNRFSSQAECEEVCVKPQGPDACLLPKVVGSCDGQFEHWYFDASSRTCETFMYGGCMGNNNRFGTKDLCEQTCLHQETLNPCDLSVSPGPCRGEYTRYHYDRQDNRCKQFIYGGCQGNANNFASEEECSERCVTLTAHEICILSKEEGRCRSQDRKWYYDYVDGQCKDFIYTGCQGNRNRFDTRELCENVCNATRVAVPTEVCAQPKQEGPCHAAILHWYYNMEASRCEQFYYGGCEGNANRFETRRDCERACLVRGVEKNICVLPQEVGNCVEFRERWYYHAEEGQCRRFYYGGCGGNDNNFASHLECEQTCGQPAPELPEEEFKPEFCSMAQEAGPCTNTEIRWFYDKTDGVCREFYYGGCLGNGNRFRTRKDCEDRCSSAQDLCTLPKVQGPCSGHFVQWFYDPKTDVCHEFVFGGCQGNANRFNDREACEARCRKGAPLPTERPPDPHPPVDACAQPKQPGPCYGLFEMWFYDMNINECRAFNYGGCEGNDNRFESKVLCEQRCMKKAGPVDRPTRPTRLPGKPKKVCKKMADPGACDQVHPRWFYDPKTGNCLPFVYSGCGGNRNRFKSAEICLSFCRGVTDAGTPDEEETDGGMDKSDESSAEELDPRSRIPTPPVPDATPLAPPTTLPAPVLPAATAAPCPASNCAVLQCPLGKTEIVDRQGCVMCRCSNPCETHECRSDEQCRIEAYRGPDGEPRYRPICRLTNKAGHCPIAEAKAQPAAVVRPDCRTVCRIDADCPEERKCCYNGCAHVCVQAVVTEGTTLLTTTSTLAPPLPPKPTSKDVLAPPLPPEPTSVPTEVAATEPQVTANAGSDVTLGCSTRGVPTPRVTWTFKDQFVESRDGRFKILVDGSLHISKLTGEDAGPYKCTAISGEEEVVHVIELVVYVSATILPTTASVTVTVSETAYLACKAIGYPKPTVGWYRNGAQLPLRSARYYMFADFTLAIRNVTFGDEDIYMCRAYNRIGRPSVWKVSLTVMPVVVSGRRRRGYMAPQDRRKVMLDMPETVTVDLVVLTEEYRVGAPLQLDCYVTGSPEPDVSWLHDGRRVDSDGHYVVMENHTLFIPSAAVSDNGEYTCVANNGYSNESVSVRVTMDDVFVPETCTDNPRFANCNLIVKARYCTNKHYSRFCCRSCMLAGQIHSNGADHEAGFTNGNGFTNGFANGYLNGNGYTNGNGYANGFNNGNDENELA